MHFQQKLVALCFGDAPFGLDIFLLKAAEGGAPLPLEG
jgi:hypothetical protein